MTPDWIETRTAQMLAAAKSLGFLVDVVRDAKHFASQGYMWDVALAMACDYWLYDPRYDWQKRFLK